MRNGVFEQETLPYSKEQQYPFMVNFQKRV